MGLGVRAVLTQDDTEKSAGTCAKVVIKLSQRLTVPRSAFRRTVTITNGDTRLMHLLDIVTRMK